MAIALVTLILGALVILYFYLTKNYGYWQKHGIPCAKGVLPGFGHMLSVMFMKTRISHRFRDIYNHHRNRSMVGFYNFMSPSLIVIEPELIKTVMQTSFTSFHENAFKIDPALDPLLANNPFFCYGDKWVTSRKRITYAFSSMRLKILLESVKQVCKTLDNYLDRKLSKSDKLEVELKDLFSKYTAQVVASAGFGVDGLCFDDEKQSMSFQNIGKQIIEPSIRTTILLLIAFIVPPINKIFGVSFLPRHIDQFFRNLVTDLMEKRRTENVPRHDFLQLMVELEKMEGDKFDVEVLASHAFSFFADGYETSSGALGFAGFQLATHPEVQEKLRKEVLSVLARYDGAITYEALKEMTYMDQVLNESQRIIPMGGALQKICTEECELRGSDGLVYRVQPGTEIVIPVDALHDDPRYWDNPKVFDPERFSPDRKHSIEKFTFLPFGEGPRICVGMRMALLQIKACLAMLLSKYRLEVSPKMHLPLEILPASFLPVAKGGLWVYIRPL